MIDSNSEIHDEGQPLSAAGEGHAGTAEPTDACSSDPKNPATEPQGTQRDQEKNIESEGQPVQLHADSGNKHQVFAFGPDVTLPVASKSKLFALINVR